MKLLKVISFTFLITEIEVLAGILGFKYNTLGTACSLGLIEHYYPMVWLTTRGKETMKKIMQRKDNALPPDLERHLEESFKHNDSILKRLSKM